MQLNKKIILGIFLLFVFAVGTVNFADTVDAAKWTKFESGSFNIKNPDSGFNKKISYVSYQKGNNNIKMELYGYKKKNNKKELLQTVYYDKIGEKVKCYSANKKGKKTSPQFDTLNTTTTLKSFYKTSIVSLKSKNSPINLKNGSTGSKLQYKYVYEYGYSWAYRYVTEPYYYYGYYYSYWGTQTVYKWTYDYGYNQVWKWT